MCCMQQKKSRFLKEQEAKGLLSSLAIKAPLLGKLLFQSYFSKLLNIILSTL